MVSYSYSSRARSFTGHFHESLSLKQISERAKTKIESFTDFNLSIEAVLSANHVPQLAEADASPSCHVEDRQWLVGSKEETGLKLRVMPEMQQHLQSMRLGK